MRLSFTKIGELICPTLHVRGVVASDQELVEDVLKCTVSSATEEDTVMTLTVRVKAHDQHENTTQIVGKVDTDGGVKVEWECTEDRAKCPECPDCPRLTPCTHAGGQPRLCVLDRSKPATWKAKGEPR